jgi:hypothetical protein
VAVLDGDGDVEGATEGDSSVRMWTGYLWVVNAHEVPRPHAHHNYSASVLVRKGIAMRSVLSGTLIVTISPDGFNKHEVVELSI